MKSEIELVNEILDVLRETAQGNYNVRLKLSEERNEMDDLFRVVNMVIDNLKANTVRLEYVDKRINMILAVLQNVASGVYSVSCELSNKNDVFDALGLGVNMMVEDIKIGIEKIEERTKELIRAKEKAEESDRLKSAFLANMSHEIRTPMNGILGFAELLKEPNLSGEEQYSYIEIIEKSGVRMLNLINDIICISRIESGLVNVNIKELNIYEQQENLFAFFKPELEAKKIEFSFRPSFPLNNLTIQTDQEKFISILTNLIKNAIKNTEKGAIEFGYIIKGAFLEFYVKDTGIGIDSKQQEAVFERFVQADVEYTMASPGVGLGLSISKAYVEMLGGKIWVESELGKGSIFYFTIPFNPES